MIRKTILTGAALLAFIVLPATASSAQGVNSVVGHGPTSCQGHWTGYLKFSPPLTNTGTALNEEIHLMATVATCTHGAPAPTSGKLVAKGFINMDGANNCANYFGTPVPGTEVLSFSPNFSGPIQWTPSIIDSSSISSAAMTVGTPALTNPVTFNWALNVTGSYSPTGAFTISTVKDLFVILGSATGNCGGGGSTPGLKKLNIATLNSYGDF